MPIVGFSQTFSSTRAKNFFKIVAARLVVPKRRIIGDDLRGPDAICSDDFMERYKLQKVNSHPSNFNLSIVQEFYFNISLKFSKTSGVVYVRGKNVLFSSSIICSIFERDISSASDISSFNTVTCHYDMNAYHREAYLVHLFLWSKVKHQSLV